jgi:hypothetical protein
VRVLLDEQMPRELAAELQGHEVRTVAQVGWKGLGNGELLAQASARFDALLTMDKAMPSQQDIARYRIGLVLVRAKSNRIEDLRPLVPEMQRALSRVQPGTLLRVG